MNKYIVYGLRKVPTYARMINKGLIRGLNYLWCDFESYLRPPECQSFPYFLDLALTDNCNLKCIMCPRTNDPSIELNEMSPSEAKKIIDKVSPYVTKIQLSGGLGEPLLYKGLFEVMDHAKDKKMDVFLTTNGTLLTEEKAHELLERGLNYISISVDGATAETYEKIRVGAKFDKVTENIRNLCTMRDEMNGDLTVELVPVVMVKENLHELPGFIRLAHELGVDGVGFSDLNDPIDGEFDPNQTIRYCEDEKLRKKIKEKFEETRALSKKLGIRLSMPGEERCREPWHMLTVATNGLVRPCCGGPYELFFGDILKEELKDIWNNEKFVNWRRKMLSDDPPPECIDCSHCSKFIW